MNDTNPYAAPLAPAAPPDKLNPLLFVGAVVHLASWILLLYGLWFVVPGLKWALFDFGIDPSQATLVVIWASDWVVTSWYRWVYLALLVVAASTLLTWKFATAKGWLKVLSRLIFSLPLILLVYSALALLGPLILGLRGLN